MDGVFLLLTSVPSETSCASVVGVRVELLRGQLAELRQRGMGPVERRQGKGDQAELV
jgi:hypothetical protein